MPKLKATGRGSKHKELEARDWPILTALASAQASATIYVD